MRIAFKTKTLPHISIKTNGNIKKSIDAYRKSQVPLSRLLTSFLAIKTIPEKLSEVDNPWAYYVKGIEKHKVESGVTRDESLFLFAAMNLKDELPTDVINAAFYSSKSRNDSDFEIGYLLPFFIRHISQKDNVLFVNPTPSMICAFEGSPCECKKRFYAVPDETVAKLYQLQFPHSQFLSFDQLQNANNIDAVLLANRDQKIDASSTLLSCLSGCNNNAKIVALIPDAWFDSTRSGAHSILASTGFSIKQALLLDPATTNSTPRKKMLAVMEKGERSTIEVVRSSYDQKTQVFSILDETAQINEEYYLNTDKTIVTCWNEAVHPKEDTPEPVYKKPEEYKFSEEISLFYKIYSERKNKFAGVAYYKEIKSIDPRKWGKKISSDIEKGLRADSRESVISAIESIVFEDKVYPIIRTDIEKQYIGRVPISLKTLWFYCWSSISGSQKYDHDFMCKFFRAPIVSNVIPQMHSGEIMLDALARTLSIDPEDIPFYRVDQVYSLLQIALKLNLIPFNPLESYMKEYSSRASERQQDVRNALVKKHFSDKEELAIFLGIIGKQATKNLLCTEKSILLASAIRLFTGMSIRETAALKWCDFVSIKGTNGHQLLITKFVDQSGRIMQHAEKQNWKRFRVIPSAEVLSALLLARKQYLIDLGINEDYLADCPIILSEERISDMKGLKRIAHCKPSVISKSGNELIKLANIPENTIVLPDERNDLITDFNRYHGDIFQTNFRDKANHSAFMTNGEINYVLGVEAPDTFSRYYCDYTNDYVQLGMIQKFCRWELCYEQMITKNAVPTPSFGTQTGGKHIEAGPFQDGVASVDLIIENHSDEDAEVIVKSIHGLEVNTTVYGGNHGKNAD